MGIFGATTGAVAGALGAGAAGATAGATGFATGATDGAIDATAGAAGFATTPGAAATGDGGAAGRIRAALAAASFAVASAFAAASAAASASACPKMFLRTFSATSSGIELECVFFSLTPYPGKRSMIALALTSSSRASSLIRTWFASLMLLMDRSTVKNLSRPLLGRCCLLLKASSLPLPWPYPRNVQAPALLHLLPQLALRRLPKFPLKFPPEFPPSPHPLRSRGPLPCSPLTIHLPQSSLRLPLPYRPCFPQPVQPPPHLLRLRRSGSPPGRSCRPSSRRFPVSPSTAPASSRRASRDW